MEHTMEEFARLAEEKFGDKVKFSTIVIPDDVVNTLKADGWTDNMIKDLKEYKHVWLLNSTCPACDSELEGVFGSFIWGIVHGYGECSSCREVSFKLYHYFKDSEKNISKMFKVYALAGF